MNNPIISPNGTQKWYRNGKCHREDGPAVIYPNGTQLWFLNGARHREDGPAVIYSNGNQYWYLNDKIYSFNEFIKKSKLSDDEIIMLKLKYE